MVDARLPLVLLQVIQRQDTPPELLPEEDAGSLFPQRLGLSGVVERQIRVFSRLARQRRGVEESQVAGLLELIVRRPDADEIFEAAGKTLAGFQLSGTTGWLLRFSRHLPQAMQQRAVMRAIRGVHGTILIADDLEIDAGPIEIRATDPLTVRVQADRTACTLYGSLAGGLLELSGSAPTAVLHPACQGRGDERCVWRIEVPEMEKAAQAA